MASANHDFLRVLVEPIGVHPIIERCEESFDGGLISRVKITRVFYNQLPHLKPCLSVSSYR